MTEVRERRLSGVEVTKIEPVTLPDGSPGQQGIVRFRLCDEAGGEKGPEVQVRLAVPADSEPAELSLLREAGQVLRRLGRESDEELALLLGLFRNTQG